MSNNEEKQTLVEESDTATTAQEPTGTVNGVQPETLAMTDGARQEAADQVVNNTGAKSQKPASFVSDELGAPEKSAPKAASGEHKDDLIDKLGKSEHLSRERKKLSLFGAMLKDYITRKYKGIDSTKLVIMILAVVYTLSPLDLLPDVIPFLGDVDDMFVLLTGWMLASDEIKLYAKWRLDKNPDDDKAKGVFETSD